MSNIPQLFWDRIDTSASEPAVYRWRDDSWRELTWATFAEHVLHVAELLRDTGASPGDRIALYSENRYEWLVIDLAIQLAGLVHVPLHAPLTGDQARFQIDHSQPRAVIVSNAELAGRIVQAYGQLPSAIQWFSLEDVDAGAFEVLSVDSAGASDPATEKLARRAVEIAPESLATILYTSGTTGEPKGVMLSQANLFTNAQATAAAFGPSDYGLRLGILPLSHIYARLCDLYVWLVQGSRFALARSRETVLEDCQSLRPHWFNAVPYFYDKCHRYLVSQGLEHEAGAVKSLFGGRFEYGCCGGAGLPVHLFDFYQEQQTPVLPGYGLTESSPVISVTRPGNARRGASGQPIDGVEVRISEAGEILTRGPHVMLGYYKNESATREVIRDGWLHTGDLGRIDEDGFVYVTGRIKEIIVTSGGKNVSPVYLENLLTQHPLIEQAMVVGDDRKYLGALIVPSLQELERLVREELQLEWPLEWATHSAVLQRFAEAIAQQLQSVSQYEQVRRFVLLDRPFSIEAGELTPKLSLRRSVIEERYAAEIEQLYA